jgi:hypothetical protein
MSSKTISFSEGLLICPAQMANMPGALEAFGVSATMKTSLEHPQ